MNKEEVIKKLESMSEFMSSVLAAYQTHELFKKTPFAEKSEKLTFAIIMGACEKFEKENDMGNPFEDLCGGESDGAELAN
jgi:hypothetical protein